MEPDYDFLAMGSVLDSVRNAKDALGKGICDPCHTQPTGSTIPDPLQTPDPEVKLSWDPEQYTRDSKKYWRDVVAQKKRLIMLARDGIAPVWRLHCPPGEKEFLHYVSIRTLLFACPPMEELILVHARYLADVDDVIWEKRDIEYVCHLGIRSIRQVEALVNGFPRLLCKSPIHLAARLKVPSYTSYILKL